MNIEFDNVSKRYADVEALRQVSFSARGGQITGFIGRNGAGKSTAMRILMGLARPDEGSATFDGRRFADVGPARVGSLLEPAAHPACRVRDHLRIRARRRGLTPSTVDEALEVLDLSSVHRRKIGRLSLGQRQRLALACAFMGTPQVLVLDEPVNGLDPEGVLWVRQYLRSRAEAGATVLVSSHLLSELDRLVDSAVLIDREVLWAGDLESMRREGYPSLEDLFVSVAPEAA